MIDTGRYSGSTVPTKRILVLGASGMLGHMLIRVLAPNHHVLGTGFAFVLFATLSKRTGAVRSMIPTYFTPIVGTVLGTTFNNEPLLILSVVGMFVVIIGAYVMSKPDS